MTERVAKSLEVLRLQINALSPNRDKSSDGGLGDEAHRSRPSDHNPNAKGVGTARDFTHDPAHGIDSEKLAEALLATRDPRIKYVISNNKIASGSAGPSPWQWRKYTGSNPHNKHVHISVLANKADEDKQWDLSGLKITSDHHAAPVIPQRPVLRLGSRGQDVIDLHTLLNKNGVPISAEFDQETKDAVKKFQVNHQLVADGIVGKYTWDKLEEKK